MSSMSSSNNNNSNMSKSSSRQNKRPAPLKMVKEEVRQYRPPVIIHTYSPKIIHVDAAQFSTMVQQLTGRGMKRKPDCSPRQREEPNSPGSSGEVVENGVPRHLLANSFDPSGMQAAGGTSANDQANLFANAVLAAHAAAATGGPQYSPLFGSNSAPHLFSPIPSPNFLSSTFMADLPLLSPSNYQNFDNLASHFAGPAQAYARYPNAASPNAFKDMALLMSRGDSKG